MCRLQRAGTLRYLKGNNLHTRYSISKIAKVGDQSRRFGGSRCVFEIRGG